MKYWYSKYPSINEPTVSQPSIEKYMSATLPGFTPDELEEHLDRPKKRKKK